MIQQIGQALQADAFFTASKVGKTGITVTVDVYNPDGTLVINGASATEVGGGYYTYILLAINNDRAGIYRYVFKTADATVDQQHLPGIWTVGEAWVERLLGTILAGSHNPQSGDSYARLGAPAGASLAADIAALPASIWNRLTSALTTVGSIGKRLADYIDAAISTRATPADISGITVQASVAVSEAVASSAATGRLAIESYHTVRQTITSTVTADLSAATKLRLAIKNDKLDSDNDAIVLIEKTDGLTRLNGDAYATPAHGSLTVSGTSGAWVIAFFLHATAAGLLESYNGRSKPAELKALVGGDNVDVWSDNANFSAGVIKAVA